MIACAYLSVCKITFCETIPTWSHNLMGDWEDGETSAKYYHELIQHTWKYEICANLKQCYCGRDQHYSLTLQFPVVHFICLPALFSFKTAEEINEKLNGLKIEEHFNFRNYTFNKASGLSTPQSVDWRKKGLVSPVQNQVRSTIYRKKISTT